MARRAFAKVVDDHVIAKLSYYGSSVSVIARTSATRQSRLDCVAKLAMTKKARYPPRMIELPSLHPARSRLVVCHWDSNGLSAQASRRRAWTSSTRAERHRSLPSATRSATSAVIMTPCAMQGKELLGGRQRPCASRPKVGRASARRASLQSTKFPQDFGPRLGVEGGKRGESRASSAPRCSWMGNDRLHDDPVSPAPSKGFVQLYRRLALRDKRLALDPKFQSALTTSKSDGECRQVLDLRFLCRRFGPCDGRDHAAETMLADMAVQCTPDDERYSGWWAKR